MFSLFEKSIFDNYPSGLVDGHSAFSTLSGMGLPKETLLTDHMTQWPPSRCHMQAQPMNSIVRKAFQALDSCKVTQCSLLEVCELQKGQGFSIKVVAL